MVKKSTDPKKVYALADYFEKPLARGAGGFAIKTPPVLPTPIIIDQDWNGDLGDVQKDEDTATEACRVLAE